MLRFIATISIAFCLQAVTGCSNAVPAESPRPETPRLIADRFAYPVGPGEYVTPARDKKDEWYDAQDFGENNHLGEDWNKNSGGNTDCGETVYAIANGEITYAADAGPGWGNVVIITHTLPDGTEVQSLYGHLKAIEKTSGTIKFREKVGTIGDGNGRYICHLHFELREQHCPSWDMVFVGYSPVSYGWVDPSGFIDSKRK